MECLAGTWNIVPCVWGFFDRHTKYIRDLEDNLASLRSGRRTLKSVREDVSNRVREAEEQQMKRRNQVEDWHERVVAMEDKVDAILDKGDKELGNKCPWSCCPKNCWCSHKVGKKVLKMIPRVTKLIEEGQFDVVAYELPPPPVDEQPMDNIVVGFESKFEEVWQSVQNNESHVIGLVGMGGVGKTTLLKQLNNQFEKAPHAYDLVIWVLVSKPANLGNIRDVLRSKLNIPDRLWENKNEDQRNGLIFSKLKTKKFLLLLDDIWEGLELSEVGIPRPNVDNISKIVFTTQSREVCRSMDAYKVIEIGCLPPDEAFSLFYSKLGEDILISHPEMRELVMDVVSECEGLPLALIIIGRAMRGKTEARQWMESKRMLEKYPATFPGMEGVFSKLMFSYDSLPNPMVKKCFEYCSLYPEDHNIFKEKIIKLWLAEGFMGEYDSMYDALIQGRQIIEILKQACLLETGERSHTYDRETETVKMHDLIRDLALWIACERGERRNKFYVEVAQGDDDDDIFTVAPNAMTNAEKISLWGTGITTKSLARMSLCPNLSTLIIQETKVKEMPGENVRSLNVLKVLHLSDNRGWMQLPVTNGCLTNLEYLNIVRSMIWVRLPTGLSQMKKLRFLIVDDEMIIPREIISNLRSLQMFEQISLTGNLLSSFHITSHRILMESEMVAGLERLKHIMDIRLVLYSTTGIQILLDSPKLQRCTTKLVVHKTAFPPGVLDLGTEALTKRLDILQIQYCGTPEIKLGRSSLGNNLCEVYIYCCDEIRNLNSLIYVPNLYRLDVQQCSSMSELIREKETMSSNVGTSLFSSLIHLSLMDLPNLRRICPQSALHIPCLMNMLVRKCEKLTKLPFDSNTVSTIAPGLYVGGEREWWDRLTWDCQATKGAFDPRFLEN